MPSPADGDKSVPWWWDHLAAQANTFRFVYRYLGADSRPDAGRFPKNKYCFVPKAPRDPVAGPMSDDFAFGDELAPVNAKPNSPPGPGAPKGETAKPGWHAVRLAASGRPAPDSLPFEINVTYTGPQTLE